MATTRSTTANEPQVANALPTKEQTEANLAVAAARRKKTTNSTETAVIAANELERLNELIAALTKRQDEQAVSVQALSKRQYDDAAALNANTLELAKLNERLTLLSQAQDIQASKLLLVEEKIAASNTALDQRLDAIQLDMEEIVDRLDKLTDRKKAKAAHAEKDRKCPHCFGEKTVSVGGETKTCPKCMGAGERGKLGRIGLAIRNCVTHPITQAVFRGAAMFAGGMAAQDAYRRYRSSGCGPAAVTEIRPAA